MKSKIVALIILVLLFLIFLFQFKEIRRLNENIKEKDTFLISIQKRNELNILDLQRRNEELKNRNEELKWLFNETNIISRNYDDKYNEKEIDRQDCINMPINIDIVKLLQKAGI